jgi:hypothetical protein
VRAGRHELRLESDNAKEIFDRYKDFEVELVRQAWGIKLEMKNAPGQAFVDGEMIRGIKEHVFAVLRDVIFISNEIIESGRFDLENRRPSPTRCSTSCAMRAVLDFKSKPNLVVCWGGHSINTEEYQYTKKVGYELGLRGLDVCTGCGPGRHEGPDEGRDHRPRQAAHRRRPVHRSHRARIIAAEPPNPIVNQLGHHAGHRKAPRSLRAAVAWHRRVSRAAWAPPRKSCTCWASCSSLPMPVSRCKVVLTGPSTRKTTSCRSSVSSPARWVTRRADRLHVIVDDPAEVARYMVGVMGEVRDYRRANSDSYNYNWLLKIPPAFQHPFEVTHDSMRALRLYRDLPAHELAADLRRAFSGIVTGNVKENGVPRHREVRALRADRRCLADEAAGRAADRFRCAERE